MQFSRYRLGGRYDGDVLRQLYDVDTSAFYPFGYCELLADKKFQVTRRLVTDDEPGLRGQDARSAR